MANYFGFTSDRINIFLMSLDVSGSMEKDVSNMRKGLEMYQKSFEGFPEAGSIAIAKSSFGDYVRNGEFRPLNEFNVSYCAYNERTALYDAIIEGAQQLQDYIREVTAKTGVTPRATFIVFSDGGNNINRCRYEMAREAIKNLNYAGITTVYVAFGESITSEFGKNMGFLATKDVKERADCVAFFNELSHSCKEQSKSLKALGANFFSQAVNSTSAAYSNTTQQALEDEDWLDQL